MSSQHEYPYEDETSSEEYCQHELSFDYELLNIQSAGNKNRTSDTAFPIKYVDYNALSAHARDALRRYCRGYFTSRSLLSCFRRPRIVEDLLIDEEIFRLLKALKERCGGSAYLFISTKGANRYYSRLDGYESVSKQTLIHSPVEMGAFLLVYMTNTLGGIVPACVAKKLLDNNLAYDSKNYRNMIRHLPFIFNDDTRTFLSKLFRILNKNTDRGGRYVLKKRIWELIPCFFPPNVVTSRERALNVILDLFYTRFDIVPLDIIMKIDINKK